MCEALSTGTTTYMSWRENNASTASDFLKLSNIFVLIVYRRFQMRFWKHDRTKYHPKSSEKRLNSTKLTASHKFERYRIYRRNYNLKPQILLLLFNSKVWEGEKLALTIGKITMVVAIISTICGLVLWHFSLKCKIRTICQYCVLEIITNRWILKRHFKIDFKSFVPILKKEAEDTKGRRKIKSSVDANLKPLHRTTGT